jgi:hypothetical protein
MSKFKTVPGTILADPFAAGIVGTALAAVIGGLAAVGYGTYRAFVASPELAGCAAGVVVVGGGIAAGVRARARRLERQRLDAVYGAGSYIALFDQEQQMLVAPCPGILTIFEAESPQAAADAVALLRARVREIAAANPWVCGRLRTGPAGAPALWVPTADNSRVPVALLERRAPQQQITDAPPTAAQYVRSAVDVFGEPVVKFSITTADDNACVFSVVVSVSHVVSDANTLYSLYGMLSPAANVTALNPVRAAAAWGSGLNLGAGATRKLWWFVLSSFGGPLQETFGAAADAYSKRGAPVQQSFTVRREWIEAEKAKHEARAAAQAAGHAGGGQAAGAAVFVSTNDLLVSWFYSAQREHIAGAAIVCDLRGRLPGVTAGLAGNYNQLLVTFAEEFEDPLTVRRCVASLGEYDAPARRDASRRCAPPKGRRRLGISTNWVRQYRDVALRGCTQLSHAPTFPIDQKGFTSMCRMAPFLTIYQCNAAGDVGVVTTTHGAFDDEAVLGPQPAHSSMWCK